jgi:hypothetical protein
MGTGAANSTATAVGGLAVGGMGMQRARRGPAVARANSTGAGGSATASATSAGGLFISAVTQAAGPVSGLTEAEARSSLGGAARDASELVGLESAAYAVGQPGSADVNEFFQGNPAARAQFNLAGDATPGATSDVFGIVTMGAAYGSNAAGNRTYTSSATFEIDLTDLDNPKQDMLVAFLDTNVQGSGFDSMTFQVLREGSMAINETFTTLDDANAFFNDSVQNIGSNTTGILGNINLTFNLSLSTNDAGAGYSFDLLFGNSTVVEPGLAADFDADGDVDGNDFLAWQRGLGAGTTVAQGDADGDGMVDADDLAIWTSEFGMVDAGNLATFAAPEPSGAVLLALAFLAVGRRRSSSAPARLTA